MKHGLFRELKRRNVLRAGVLYIGAVWALAQGISQLGPAVGAPEWITRWFLVAASIGFPFFMAFAWFYEITPQGLKRESEIDPAESITVHTGRKLDRLIFAVMGLAIVLLLTNTFVWHKGAGLDDAARNMEYPPDSIAVLPFTNLSADKNQGYFSDGISEDLLNLLAKVPQLQVTARSSSFYFKGMNLPVSEIARRLHVAHLLEGSVQKVGNQVRISVQLVDAGSDTQSWSQTWDRSFDDIFKLQDQVAAAVVKALKVKLLGAMPKLRPTNPKAYPLFLQAKALEFQYTTEAFRQSSALLRKVLAMAPRYAPAWDRLGLNFAAEAGTSSSASQSRELFAQAREAENKALAIDPNYASPYAVLGFIADMNNDPAGAAGYYQHALALDPTNLSALGNAAELLQDLGRLDESLTIFKAMVRRDPVNTTMLDNLGYIQREAGRYDAAVNSFRTVLSLSPGYHDAHSMIGVALLLKGHAHEALSEFEQEKDETARMIGLPLAYCALGRKSDADQAIAGLITKHGKDAPYAIAYDYAFCGNADKAFEWLDRAAQDQDTDLVNIVSENLFDKIHSDPRWLPFLRKIGKAPEQLAKIRLKVTLPKAWQAQDAAAVTAQSSQ